MKQTKKEILKIKNLSAWYEQLQILYNINMHINKGEIVSIIGPNGAGKSTILKSIFGFIEKRTGSILFHNQEITSLKTHELVSKGIGYVPQGRIVFPGLTVLENLEMGAYTRTDKKEIKKDLQELQAFFPQLQKHLHTNAGLLSGGEQQIVSLARALMSKPKLLLMDEPTLGLSPQMKLMLFQKIKELRDKLQLTILIVEQNAKLALDMSDRAYVLEAGRNKLEGIGNKLLHDKRVQHLYLGGEF